MWRSFRFEGGLPAKLHHDSEMHPPGGSVSPEVPPREAPGERAPDASTVFVVPESGHHVYLDNAPALVEKMMGFLRRVQLH